MKINFHFIRYAGGRNNLFLLLILLSGVLALGCVSQQPQPGREWPISAEEYSSSAAGSTEKLIWPIDCKPGVNCDIFYPDIDKDGKANCGQVGSIGHEGTDIGISWGMMEKGTDVYAAADGVVKWVFDGKYDRCENFGLPFGIKLNDNPDCNDPAGPPQPGASSGYRDCTERGDYCNAALKTAGGNANCVWCFYGGNVIVILHDANKTSGVFATRYDHLKNGSILVRPGDKVKAGQKIAEAGSAGRSSGPHLHFEVWSDWYTPIDPWAPSCGPTGSLWRYKNPANQT